MTTPESADLPDDTPAAEDYTVDLSILDPETSTLVLPECGEQVVLIDLKTRQFFRLLKILTRGAGGFLGSMNLNADGPPEVFIQQLLTWTVLSIPEAEEEAIDFIKSMVLPVGLYSGRNLDKRQREQNQVAIDRLAAALDNPELEDTLAIFQAIVTKEGKDIQRLGKKLASMFKLAQQTGQTTPEPPSPVLITDRSSIPTASSVDTLAPSI